MNETGGHCAKKNKTEEDKHCIASFICGIFKKWTYRNRQMAAWGWDGRNRNREELIKGNKISAIRWIRPKHLVYNMVGDDTILHRWNLLRVIVTCSHQKKRNIWGDRYFN